MYRHFAVLTLVISLSVAFVAGGEQKRTVVAVDQPKVDKLEKKERRPRSEIDVLNGVSEDPSPVRAGNSPPPPPQSGADEGPLELAPSDDGQFHPNRFTYHRAPPRPDPALIAKMTPEQRAGYLKALALRDGQTPDSPGGPAAQQSGPSQSQINRLVSASRARSGGGGD